MNYLSVENLTKSYGIRVLFEDITFGIDKGQKVAFIAKNGTGKSTFLKILAGKEGYDSGNVIFYNFIPFRRHSTSDYFVLEKFVINL